MEILLIGALVAAGFLATRRPADTTNGDEAAIGLSGTGALITAFVLDAVTQVTESVARDRIVSRAAYVGQHLATPILPGLDYDAVMFGVYTAPTDEEAMALSLAVGFGAAITVTNPGFLEGITLRPGSVIVGSVGSWATMPRPGFKQLILTRRAVRHGVLGNVVGVTHDYITVDTGQVLEEMAADGRWIIIAEGAEE